MEEITMIYTLRVTSLLLVALALVPAGAHLFAMVNKFHLDRAEYLISQRAYDGWSLFSIVIVAALVSTLTLAIQLNRSGEPYWLVATAFLCIAATQVIFWLFTFPANKATQNWTVLPEGWEMLRHQWEYSHAASAILNFVALLFLLLSIVRTD
jgi:hypothetical protein